MNITFWVTETCNLACKYCYVDKNAKTMKTKTAITACQKFKKRFDNSINKKEKIYITFHGGEPLLNFNVIFNIIEWFKKHYFENIAFSLTTNGTIYNEKIFNFLIENNVEISISMDGNKEINDTNRRLRKDDGSVYDMALRTFEYFKEKNVPVRIRMTVTKSNIASFYENYRHLYELSPTVVSFAFDKGDCWTKEDMERYYENYSQIMDFLIAHNRKDAYYELYNMIQEYFRYRESCDGGKNGFQISVDGKIYPCMLAVGKDEFVIGNVYTGVDDKALIRLEELNNQKVQACSGCSLEKRCAGTICKVINKYYTGDAMLPPVFTCNEQEVLYHIYKKYNYLLGESYE